MGKPLAQQVHQVDRLRGASLGVMACPFERQQLVHGVRGTRDALPQPVVGFLQTRGVVAMVQKQVGIGLDHGQRRLELVRGIGQEFLVAFNALGQALHQPVHGSRQRCQFAVAGGWQ